MAIVYHYCKYDIFKKIIMNKTLRLSDIRKSNDKYEMNLFLEQYKGIGEISKIVNYSDNGRWEDLENYFKYITDETRCFASCLSIGADRLSQWERYGGKCEGLAIGFNKEKLLEHIEKVAESLSENNDSDIDTRIIAQKVTYKKLKSGSYPSEMWEKFEDIDKYFEECAFTKHRGFNEEKEFRVAMLFQKGNRGFLSGDFLNHIGADKSNLKSYNISEIDDENYIDLVFPATLIEKVYIGPLSQLEENVIKSELQQNGIWCKIKKSEIPYMNKLTLLKDST